MSPDNSQGEQTRNRRRGQIATAAIEVLAAQGFRGLTHRAVDTAAGLNPGSVNYHAPNRQRLVHMALEELFARDFAVATEAFGVLEDAAVLTTELVVDRMRRFIEAMTNPPADRRVIARHILLGEAQHNADIGSLFDSQRAAFVTFAEHIVASLGTNREPETPEMLVVLIEGIIQRQVLFGSRLDGPSVERMLANLLTRPAPR